MIVLGVDPGATGGLAWTTMTGTMDSMAFTRATEQDISKAFATLGDRLVGTHAYLEKVHAFPGQGVSSSFNFGSSYGFLRGCLISHGIPFETVTPQKWQKTFGLIRKNKVETITQKKNRHKARAQELFPHLKVNHATADCLLIAEFGRRLRVAMGARA